MPMVAITTNSRHFTRAFLVDPNINLGGNSLPYTQTNNAGLTNNAPANQPTSARFTIVSTLATALMSA